MDLNVKSRDVANPLWNVWSNTRDTLDLYRRRCRREAEEMTCAAQAAKIIATTVSPGETLLDAGCGGGYYYWSFADRNMPLEYYGLDYTPEMIKLAREEMAPRAGLPTDRFILGSIENLDRAFDNVICFNVLTNCPHYAYLLERLLLCTKKRILIRESMGPELKILYLPDRYLDEGKRHMRQYFNTYPVEEVKAVMAEYGFEVIQIRDERSGDGTELVCDIPHTWKILLGERKC